MAESDKKEEGIQPNPIIDSARREQAQRRAEQETGEISALGTTLLLVERGGVPELLENPERVEALDEVQEETTRTIFEPIVMYTRDARTGFVTKDWQMTSEWMQAQRVQEMIKTKSSIHRPYKPEKAEGEERADLEKKKRIHELYQSKVKEELTRIASFSQIMADGFGPMGMYFSGREMVGVNQRRLTVTPTDTFRKAFGEHRDKVLNEYSRAVREKRKYERAQKKLPEAQRAPLPENVRKVLIENGPKFFEEGFTDQVKEGAARMYDLANVISEMNKRNPFVGEGEREMRIDKEHLTMTEQSLIAALFQKTERINEHGVPEGLGDLDRTNKIRIFFGKDGKQMPIDKAGNPIGPDGRALRKLPDGNYQGATSKDIYINVLAYENTVKSEADHKKFMALMIAYTMTGAREKLLEIAGAHEGIDINASEDDKKRMGFEQLTALKNLQNLRETVNLQAKEILDDWDSPRILQEREAAAAAFELNFMLECATLSIANLGHAYVWKQVEVDENGKEIMKKADRDKVPDSQKRFMYQFVDEIGDPDMAFDAMTAMFTLHHEYTYAAIKNRISTPLLPPASAEFAEKMVNFVVNGGRDPELLAYAEKSPYIARGYGIIGMFPDELGKNAAWQEGAALRNQLGRECNEEFIQMLEQTMFGVPTVFNGEVFPMPITPFFRSIGLFDSMHVSKDRTVQDVLNDRHLLTEIDYDQYHPFAGDSRMVVGRFATEMTYMMYGAADKKGLDEFFSVPAAAIRKIIKAMDIGGRAEARKFKFAKKDLKTGKRVTDSKLFEQRNFSRKFFEITHASYMSVAYLAFYTYGLWDGNENFKENKTKMIDGIINKELPGLLDFVEAGSYLLDKKQEFEHYRDSFVLLLLGLTEFAKGIGVRADALYPDAERLRKAAGDFIAR